MIGVRTYAPVSVLPILGTNVTLLVFYIPISCAEGCWQAMGYRSSFLTWQTKQQVSEQAWLSHI